MPRPRDSRRKRLYDAENVLLTGAKPMSLAEVQAYADKVLGSTFVQSRWGRRTVRVVSTHGGAHSYGGTISFSVWARQPSIVLHELAHELLIGKGFAAHGPEFAATLLTLVQRFLGAEAARTLRASYREHGVRYRTGMKAVPTAGTRTVVPRREVAARERAARTRPVTPSEKAEAAAILRRAIANGVFGPPGRKPRAHAQAVARTLEA